MRMPIRFSLLTRPRPRPAASRFLVGVNHFHFVAQRHNKSTTTTTNTSTVTRRRRTTECVTVAVDPATTSKVYLTLFIFSLIYRSCWLKKMFFSDDELRTLMQDQVLDSIRHSFKISGRPSNAAAVVLASRSLASWLQDATFLSQLVRPLVPASSAAACADDDGAGEASRGISLLGAAVDAIPIPSSYVSGGFKRYTAAEGLSVLHGEVDDILPGIWEMDLSESPSSSSSPALEFHVPGVGGGEEQKAGLEVTLPLANTLFDNGREWTLLASRWVHSSSSSGMSLVEMVERSGGAKIMLRGTETTRSHIRVPLVPITKPRRVVAGLGNILRQVEVDGRPVPASKELEEVIPKLLAARTDTAAVGPIGVWAVIYPESVARDGGLPSALEVGASKDKGAEWRVAREVEHVMGGLLGRGCHMRRILSGGGGWGLKQGLLSLDPQTKYATADQDDIESFIRSFHGEDGDGTAVITPGSFVQFMVEPVGVAPTETQDDGKSPSVILGTQGLGSIFTPGGIRVHKGVFGGLSAHGMYLASEGTGKPGITTKIDASGSFVCSG
ncbi:hypothetical protein QBC47DRAFT_382218 [Echria macrotheca]|uniref:Uncharacterized protein n=1 Tax=Echria macrotheca TaxID=438768 RepID=A0AAJ0BB03_9PEZI|nr:hypothetical protein QBC47DRAFT_382218 [Echria macrotheca]